jgi:uncharacterized GH25 family protein
MTSLIAILLAVTTQPSFSIHGKVTDTQGKPIESAKVYVMSAASRPQAAADCPAIYKGVGTSTASDASGAFILDAFDSRLSYHIVVAADHFKAKEISASINSKKPLAVKLQPQPADLNADNLVTGHVVDPDGKPVAGALISINGEAMPNGHQFGGIQNVDQRAVSGEDGAFTIVADRSGRNFDLLVEHPSFASQLTHAASGETCEISLSRGTSVTGRLVKDGQPLAGVEMSIAQSDRNSERCVGFFSTGTDAEGKFKFDHLPASDQYQIIAAMQSLGDRGATSPVTIKSNADETPADAGDLTVEPAFTVSGEIILPPGKKIPPNASAFLSIEDSADSTSAKIAPDGKFKFTGVRRGTVQIWISAKGLAFSPENTSYFSNYHSMVGRVDGDTTLRIKLEEADPQKTQNYSNEGAQPFEAKPLEGIPDDSK